MIPKKIHYFWFGKGKKSDLALHCIESWKKNQPDFEIIEWTEDNFDVFQNTFIKEAYEKKKWAFVSDYARAKILYEQGGFYLDTDMELRLPLNEFIPNRAICGFEIQGVPYSAFWAVEKEHPLAKDIMSYYENLTHFEEVPNTKIFSQLLIEKYGADGQNDSFQTLKEGIILYPSHYFSLDLPKNYITHHFSGSWHTSWSQEDNIYKKMVNTYGILKLLRDIPNGKEHIKNVIYNHQKLDIDEILSQFPLKYLIKHIIKEILKRLKLK